MLKKTRCVWMESPVNPMVKVIDVGAIDELAHKAKALAVVDNTFASPYLQQPPLLGADLVTHSTTKYLGGHPDLVGGAVVGNAIDLPDHLKFIQNAAGRVCVPFDSSAVRPRA